MPPQDLETKIENLKNQISFLQVSEHEHDGNDASRVKYNQIFGESPSNMNTDIQTIATTGNTDWYIIAPISGDLEEADFSGTDALAANDTNYITFSIVNLGRDGTGTTNLFSTGNVNTTKATGGTAISANTVRELTLSSTKNATKVIRGDRLRIRAAVTNTLANTVTNSVFTLRFK